MPYSSMQFVGRRGRARALLTVNKHDLPTNFKFRAFALATSIEGVRGKHRCISAIASRDGGAIMMAL
ncbi:hypothetical protein L905_08455 [Agrobacterium sp. TS43]|nr:hypothetical protein L902_22890 [Agrobacterium radiobacter DSM 30147]KDR90654.1 hypothetical protein K538_00040 [Agrobacterium tumefaciens GW4]KVK50791.1 hypothetical protein L903_16580 [Agrobacterium sp. JL28]KVK51185.1 hypothetical protein L904_17560 [Agrobacterium sp. LY4]KVK55711.1 hypothetical protein L905_08455 [Agrobacterium sp. TS43]KVK63237.1 hypothetical protein L906_16530 [Agrobacterium sp. TS45]KVK67909.1 hypothetical protein L907_17475 [Agrobacterium sp. C13]